MLCAEGTGLPRWGNRPRGGEWEEKEDRAGRYLAGRARVPSRPNSALRSPSSAAVLPPPHRSRPTRPPLHPPTPLLPLTLLSDSHRWLPHPSRSQFALLSLANANLPSPSLFHPIVLFLRALFSSSPFFFFHLAVPVSRHPCSSTSFTLEVQSPPFLLPSTLFGTHAGRGSRRGIAGALAVSLAICVYLSLVRSVSPVVLDRSSRSTAATFSPLPSLFLSFSLCS